ncbi:hypothetical protein ACFLVP_00495 [Chloroflexota bacterium]
MEKPRDEVDDTRKIKKLTLLDGLQVGVKNLDNILSEVADLKLTDPQTLKQELLERVKACGSYVPASAEEEYSAGLLREYQWKYGETEEIRDRNKIEPHKHTKG